MPFGPQQSKELALLRAELEALQNDRERDRALIETNAAKLARLEAELERYRTLIEASSDIIVVHDGERFLFVNGAGAAAFGVETPEQFIGKPVLDAIDPEHRQSATLRMQKLLAGQTEPPIRTRLCRHDGTRLDVEILSTPVIFDGKRAVCTVCREITEKQKLEQHLTLADRLAALGTLAAGAAHEINNPLAALVSTIEFVGEEIARAEPPLESAKDVEQALGEAREAAGRIARIVRDLKTFARVDDDSLKPVDVRSVIDSMIALAWNAIVHRAALHRDYSDVPRVMANESKLGSVFLNLIMNALQAIPEGAGPEHEVLITVKTTAQGDVAVDVHDTGEGIPKELLYRVFDPFFTTRRIGDGQGLGLSVCHAVVTALGGQISVESAPGAGSTFHVLLPPAKSLESARPISSPPDSRRLRRLRVLVVDDDPAVANGLRRTLRDHEVVVVRSGREAVRRVVETVPAFDVIVCDLMMPEVSGMDVYEQLLEQRPSAALRMVFVTGGAFTPRAREFLDRVSRPRLNKPYDAEELRRLVRRVADQADACGTRSDDSYDRGR